MNIGLAVNIGKTKYMEGGFHRGIMAKENISEDSNLYDKVKTFRYLCSLLTIGKVSYVYFTVCADIFISIHVIKQSPSPRLSVCLSARNKLKNYCTDFHAVFSNR